MLRLLSVVAAVIVGMIGLAMSLCGGGFLLGGGFSYMEWPWVLLALGSLAAGVLLIWACRAILRKDEDGDR